MTTENTMQFQVEDCNSHIAIFKKNPSLRRVEALFKLKPRDTNKKVRQEALKVVKYIIHLYSWDSPINEDILVPIEERKFKTAAKFKLLDKGEVPEEIKEELFDLKNKKYVEAVHQFLIFQKNHDWTEICVLRQTIDEYQRQRLMPMTLSEADKKDKLRRFTADAREDLEKLERKFYGKHSDVGDRVKELLIGDTLEERVLST